jgi:CO/xanthine dehydrogenase FAD-binding subunit
MTDSRIIDFSFRYFAPETLKEALTLIKQHQPKPLAGGTDLLNNMKLEGVRPEGILYLLNIGELDYLETGSGLTIGAVCRLSDIEDREEVKRRYPALWKGINVIGGRQIRNMATLGGNICNASPGADTPPVLMVLGAEVEIQSLDASGEVQKRNLGVEDFFTGPKKTVLEQDELVTAVRIPEPAKHSGQSFGRLARVTLDIAKINCAVYLLRDEDRIGSVRIAFGAVAPVPVRAKGLEKKLAGRKFSTNLVESSLEELSGDIKPIDDVRSTAEYRFDTAKVLVRDGLSEAWKQAGGS